MTVRKRDNTHACTALINSTTEYENTQEVRLESRHCHMHRGDQVMETATFTISQHNMASAKCERYPTICAPMCWQ